MVRTYELDMVDYRILNILVQDAKLPYSEVARQIQVSAGTVHGRMNRLEELGIVRRATLSLDLAKLGYGTQVYIGITLLSNAFIAVVTEKLREIIEVTDAYFATGPYHIFTCLRCRNNEHLRAILRERIELIEGVVRTETLVLLDELFSRPVALKAD
ncbi:Lrp/AsnC family transcriptional regulator [Hymenobacter psoromatis]|uniref:Lrp/AsnC family transcriptional regulator n=1 Tax=Hymenobacter psoromatis TaxID=1484116 RepID=UPI001CBE70BA|nr:AsnC family transcriptional regulator [Hymenobacter psoromatis]